MRFNKYGWMVKITALLLLLCVCVCMRSNLQTKSTRKSLLNAPVFWSKTVYFGTFHNNCFLHSNWRIFNIWSFTHRKCLFVQISYVIRLKLYLDNMENLLTALEINYRCMCPSLKINGCVGHTFFFIFFVALYI